MNVIELLELSASIDPDRVVMTFEQQHMDGRSLVARIDDCAQLLTDYGLSAGSTVVSLDVNVPAQPILFLASARLGLTFATLNPRATATELDHMFAALDPAAVIIGEQLGDVAGVVGERADVPTAVTDSWARSLKSVDGRRPGPPPDQAEESPALVLFTSGTVAAPKPFPFTHDGLSTYVAATVTPAEAEPTEATLLSVPLYHIAGVAGLLGALFAGRRLVPLPRFSAPAWLDTVADEQITHAFVVPTMLRRIVELQRSEPRDLQSLTVLSYGAAPMPAATLEAAIDVLPSAVGFVNAFGQTETISAVTVLGPDDHRIHVGDLAERERRRLHLRSVGRPLDGVTVRIVDDQVDVATGQVGEIWVSADWLRTPDEIDSAGRGWRHTGDLGWLDEDGYLFLAGRTDDVIIRGAENISPAQVEAVLESHPDVLEACVVGLPDAEWGERLSASLITRGGAVDIDELIDFARERLGSLKTPAAYHLVDELPRNALGKVLRRVVRAQLVSASAADTDMQRG